MFTFLADTWGDCYEQTWATTRRVELDISLHTQGSNRKLFLYTKGLPCFQSETNKQYHQRSLHLDSRPKIVPGAIVIVYTYDGPSLCTCYRLIQIEVMITVTLILRLLFFTQLLIFFRINLSNVIIVYFFIFSSVL